MNQKSVKVKLNSSIYIIYNVLFALYNQLSIDLPQEVRDMLQNVMDKLETDYLSCDIPDGYDIDEYEFLEIAKLIKNKKAGD